MSSFTSPLTVTKISARLWKVERAFEYHIGTEESNDIVYVPQGFNTDFASVPRAFWMLLPPDGEYTQAAVLHDYLYAVQIFLRKKSDDIFLEAMQVLGVGWWKRHTMHFAVRRFAWIVWRKRRNKFRGRR